jgi:hypothetical protein
MSKEQTKQLKFLKPFGDDIRISNVVARLHGTYADANELIMITIILLLGLVTYGQVGHTIYSIAVGRSSKNVCFGFIGVTGFRP